MRGKGVAADTMIDVTRITPAYAGKRAFVCAVGKFPWDHPRLCGEKANLLGVTTDYLGSLPPMRGKENKSVLNFTFPGITPAYAGKSFFRRCGRYS